MSSQQETPLQDGTQSLKQDYRDLNEILIPLPDLRVIVNDLMKDGIGEIPLGDLLYTLKTIANNPDA